MFIGRERELQELQYYDQNERNKILVVYGQKGLGKTTLLKHFLEGKEAVSYEAVSCSFREQKSLLTTHLRNIGRISEASSFGEILLSLENSSKDKLVFLIDEFHHMCKTGSEFGEGLELFLTGLNQERKLFIILCTSSVSWLENNFRNKDKIDEIKNYHFYKVKELSYKDFCTYFSKFNTSDSVGGFSILGGVPGLWKYFRDELSLRENIEKAMLNQDRSLFFHGQEYISDELRETAVYNTILLALAAKKEKLSEISLYTGFSGAKISVYLKNLIQLDLVEKISSISTKGKDETRKGSYRIIHPFVHFYYRFLFSNLNRLFVLGAESFYDEVIRPEFSVYVKNCFKKICCEFIEEENKRGRLPGNFTYLGEWNGKIGSIDFIFQSEEDEILCGICCWDKEVVSYDQYTNFIECTEKAGIEVDFTIFFSGGKFHNRLKEEAKKNPRLALLSIDQMG